MREMRDEEGEGKSDEEQRKDAGGGRGQCCKEVRNRDRMKMREGRECREKERKRKEGRE